MNDLALPALTIAEAVALQRLDRATATAVPPAPESVSELEQRENASRRQKWLDTLTDEWVVKFVGRFHLSALSWDHITEFQGYVFARNGFSKAVTIVSQLKSLYRHAVGQAWVHPDKLDMFEKLNKAERNETKAEYRLRRETFTKNIVPGRVAVERLIEVAEDVEILVLFLLLNFGLRSGELRALCWRNLRFHRGGEAFKLVVKEAIDHDDEYAPKPKTKKGRRPIEFHERFCHVISRFYPGDGHENDLVFTDKNGKHWKSRHLLDLIVDLCERADAAYPDDPRGRFTPRGLRRAAHSWWDRHGVHETVMHNWAGHTSHMTTIVVYITDLDALEPREPHFALFKPAREPVVQRSREIARV